MVLVTAIHRNTGESNLASSLFIYPRAQRVGANLDLCLVLITGNPGESNLASIGRKALELHFSQLVPVWGL